MAEDDLTLLDLLDRAAARWPDRPAWTFDTDTDAPATTLTFAEVAQRVTSSAIALHEHGVGPGDRVAVMLGNEPDFPLTWLALARLGAAMVPLNVRYGTADAAHPLADAGVRLAVTGEAHLDLLTPLVDRVVLARDLGGRPASGWSPAPPDPGAIVNVQYTSGTTGHPKGCLLSHRYWTTLAGSMTAEFPHLTSDDVMLTAQPFSYVDPQWNVVTALLAGAHLVVLDGFHPSRFWATVREHRVTYFYCLASMPTLLLRMPTGPADRDHRVRVVQCSAIPTALHAELEDRWGVGWYEAFGMTETGADLRVGPAEHDELVGTGCLGRPAAHREAQLVDGELWLRGDGMMDGYLGHPDPFVDGWFRTGDLARVDDRGRYYLTGRLKDMIRRSGENIAAREVEEVLLAHPSVHLAAVVGVPDELRGEEVLAYLVAPGATVEELVEWCRTRLAGFKVPSRWELREELPMTPSHRVAKALLRPTAPEVTR